MSELVTVDELIEDLRAISDLGKGSGKAYVIVQTGTGWPAGNGVKYDKLVSVSPPLLMDRRSLPVGLWSGDEEKECVIISPYKDKGEQYDS